MTLAQDVASFRVDLDRIAAQVEANKARGERHDEQISGTGGVTAATAKLEAEIASARAAIQQMVVEVTTIRTKVAIWSGAGGLAGAGLVSVVVAILTRSPG